jgi:hypothetical protein
VLVQELAHLAFGQRAHEAVHRLAVLHQDDRGDAADAEGAGQLLLVVGVDLRQLEAAAVLHLQLFQDRADGLAGSAPGRPEVHQHGLAHGGGNDLLLEVLYGDVDHAGSLGSLKVKSGSSSGIL